MMECSNRKFHQAYQADQNKRRKLQVLVKNLPKPKPPEPKPFFGKGKDLEIVLKLSTSLPFDHHQQNRNKETTKRNHHQLDWNDDKMKSLIGFGFSVKFAQL
ncbi:hypothetical protein ACE6H2_007535 [Prunus campanulata]